MSKTVDLAEYAKRFGKHDLERLGIFVEMPYCKVRGKPLPSKKGSLEYRRNPLAGGPKTKCGNMDGYFDDVFIRGFANEGRGKRKKQPAKYVSNKEPFCPPGPSKKHSCPGDYFGTFAGKISSFGGRLRPQKAYQQQNPNPVTSPGKKGGPGYINITIGKYPTHFSPKLNKPKKSAGKGKETAMVPCHFPQPYFHLNPYVDPKKDPPSKRIYIAPKEPRLPEFLTNRAVFVPTGPGKKLGGCKAGGFNKFPEYKGGKPRPVRAQAKIDKETFSPQSYGFKTMYTTSMLYKTDFSMNATNWTTYQPNYTKYLLK